MCCSDLSPVISITALFPVISATTSESFPVKLKVRRIRHETKSIQRGADHWRTATARGRGGATGDLPGDGHSPADILPLVVQVRRSGCQRGEAAEGAGEREWPVEAHAGGPDAGECRDQGCLVKKVVKPAQKREVVKHWVTKGLLSERKGCEVMGISRTAHQPQRPAADKNLKAALQARSEQYPRYGYLMLHGLLRNEGLVVNCHSSYRIRGWVAVEEAQAQKAGQAGQGNGAAERAGRALVAGLRS